MKSFVCFQGFLGSNECGCRFPSFFSSGIVLPFDEVDVSPSRFLVFSYCFDFVLFFAFDKVRWRFWEVGSVDFVLMERGKKGCVESVVNFPSFW